MAARVEALLALLTDEQKLGCLAGVPDLTLRDGYRLPGIANDGMEGLHGAGQHPDVTMFPPAIGLSATWDVEPLEAVGGWSAARPAPAIRRRLRDRTVQSRSSSSPPPAGTAERMATADWLDAFPLRRAVTTVLAGGPASGGECGRMGSGAR